MHIGQLLARAARHHPASIAWFDGDRAVAYREVAERVSRISAALIGLGAKPGDRVGMLLANGPHAIEVMFATMNAGLVIVPLNIRLRPEEHKTILADAGCSVLVYGTEFADALAPFRDQLPCLRTYVRSGDGAGDDLTYDALLSGNASVPRHEPGPEDLAWLFYTSGTTGVPKGVMLTHRNLLTMVAINQMDLVTVSPGDVLLHAIPISFAGGFFMLHHIAWGATHVFMPPRFDLDTFCHRVQMYGVTTVGLVPTMINMVVRFPGRTQYDLSSLRTIFYGGAPMHGEPLREAMEAFGPIFLQSYGLGEAPMTITVLPKDEHDGTRAQSAGRATSLVSLRIQDDDWRALPVGSIGEVAVRGDLVMNGYWNRPDITADVLQDGWLRTGDVGHLDENGYLFISDRKKDIIKSGGNTVSPREVENVIHLHPAVQEAAVVGVPDEVWGETIKALVVLRPGTEASKEEILSFCQERLASFKRPRSVELVTELPKGATNKVLRRVLRDRYWQAQSRKV